MSSGAAVKPTFEPPKLRNRFLALFAFAQDTSTPSHTHRVRRDVWG